MEKTNELKVRAITYTLIGVIGCGLFMNTCTNLISKGAIKKHGILSKGVVVKSDLVSDGGVGMTWNYIIEFKDKEGVPHRITNEFTSKTQEFILGDSMDLCFLQEEPENAILKSEMDKTNYLSLFGYAVLSIGLLLGINNIRKLRSYYRI